MTDLINYIIVMITNYQYYDVTKFQIGILTNFKIEFVHELYAFIDFANHFLSLCITE